MTKTEIRQSLEKSGKDFLGLYEVAEILGIDRGTARRWLNGLPYIPNGRRKIFHINDVAERLMQMKETGR